MTKLLMCTVLSAAVVAIAPVTASAEAETIATTSKGMDYATGPIGKKHLGKLTDGTKYLGFPQTPPPGYYGNWGFTPGGDYWDRNDMWRRSLGFWDTNSPACPFRSC
jgi:arylsulfatase A-like enzyme